MKRTDIAPGALVKLRRRIAELVEEASRCVARERAEALVRKWAAQLDVAAMSERQTLCTMADAALLSTDLVLSQVAASGTTAFDRLARSRKPATGIEAAALAALCRAQFRLLQPEGDPQRQVVTVRDLLTQEVLRAVDPDLPALPGGTVLFARVAMLDDGFCCFAGVPTPLDPAALAVARGCTAAGAQGAAGVRWAEAVYCHVVQRGTLDVPGLNRPSEDFDYADDASEPPLFVLSREWEALGDGAPDTELLQRTRALADLRSIAEGLMAATLAGQAGQAAAARALERMLLVQLETVLRRERGGSGTLTLQAIEDALDVEAGAPPVAGDMRRLFASLRKRLAGSVPPGKTADDPALERLIQRIQGLRAKTVAQGCTEQEALAAAEKVAELLDRYGLSLGELDFRAQPCDGIGIQTNRRRLAPIDNCVPAIAAYFDCRVWLEHAKGEAMRYVFFGLRGDVAAAQYLYEMVERAFDTETSAFRAGALYAEMAGDRRSATNSFQIGMAHGIAGKLDAMRAAREASRRSASGRDLVPVKAAMVDEEMAKLGLSLQSRALKGKRVLTDAFSAGEEAGARFQFVPPITQAA